MTRPPVRLAIVALVAAALTLGPSQAASARAARFRIPSTANQLIVVSSPTYDPPGNVATLRVYSRNAAPAPWHSELGPWPVEIGYGHLRDHRREGEGSTPTGVFGFGTTIYGNLPDPGAPHFAYHRLTCGDWWDEDPYSPRYNQFVHVACGLTPAFAARSEPLWTETTAYPYFAVIRFNVDPTIRGPNAPGSGIFLHSWVGGPTAGCVALQQPQLVAVLRWLMPSAHPVIEIGTDRELAALRVSRQG